MDTETTFELLSSPVRRNVIALLHDAGRMPRSELTAKLADAMGDAAGPESSPPRATTRRQLRISLHHNHLPRLAEAGVVEYDDDAVTATPALESLAQSLVPSDVEASSALV